MLARNDAISWWKLLLIVSTSDLNSKKLVEFIEFVGVGVSMGSA